MSEVFMSPRETNLSSCCGGKDDKWGTERAESHHDIGIDVSIIAKELNELSVQEREKVFEDIHGVGKAQKESPEFLTSVLLEYDKKLDALSRRKRKAFDRAMFLRPELRTNRKFKLMFLRTDNFDVDRAAQRMATYFTQKIELFGEEKLVKPITVEDLQEKEVKLIESGAFFELAQKDPIGRPIFLVDFSKFDFDDTLSTRRAAWFDIVSSSDDEDSLRNGFVTVAYCPRTLLDRPEPLSRYPEHSRRLGMMFRAIPRRITSYHFCYEDKRFRTILTAIQQNFGKAVRLRLRPHFGSPVEMEYGLMTYGIHCEGLMQQAEYKRKMLDLYFQNREDSSRKEREGREREEAVSDIVIFPGPSDALIGRGHPYHDFCGTKRLFKVIDAHMDRYYESPDRFHKTCVAMDVVKRFQEETSGRFLQRTDIGWKVMDDSIARSKLVNLFRYRSGLQSSHSALKDAKQK